MEQIQTETVNFEVDVLPIEKFSTTDSFVLRVKGKVATADEKTVNESIFPLDELKVKYKTIEFMPLNLNHNQEEIIGTVTNAELVYPDNRKPEMWIYGVIWDFLKPDIGSILMKTHKLTFSVEVHSEKVFCPICHHELAYLIWKKETDLCEHWKKSKLRAFKDFSFIGCAILLPPFKPAVRDAKAELFKIDFTKITVENLKKLSDEELLNLHQELHNEYRKKFEKYN